MSYEFKGAYHQASREDIAEGWLWFRDDELKGELEGARCVVRITHTGAGGDTRSIYCEALYADPNDISRFEEYRKSKCFEPLGAGKLVFVNRWYHDRLGIVATPGTDIDLKLSLGWFRRSWWRQLRACLQHPQVVVRLATWLGLLGLVLGIIGIVVGVMPLLHCQP